MASWAFSSLLFAIFIFHEDVSIPLLTQPFIFGVLALICYLQTIFYSETRNDPVRSTILYATISGFIAIPSLVGGIVFLQNSTALNVIGIAATVFLVIGFIPQFIEIYRLVSPYR
jgi:uncharacterized protein with PQ loop repeat